MVDIRYCCADRYRLRYARCGRNSDIDMQSKYGPGDVHELSNTETVCLILRTVKIAVAERAESICRKDLERFYRKETQRPLVGELRWQCVTDTE